MIVYPWVLFCYFSWYQQETGRVGSGCPCTGSSVTLPQNQDLHLSAHPARPLRFLGICSIRERSRVELMVTVSTEDECLSVASSHHLLPQSFSFGDIFQLPDVVNLKWSLHGCTVFTLFLVQPFDDFGPAQRPDVDVGLFVNRWVVR